MRDKVSINGVPCQLVLLPNRGASTGEVHDESLYDERTTTTDEACRVSSYGTSK